jgi:hypothetical protein
MVLIKLKDDIATFVCTKCGRVITTGENFLVNLKAFPENKITISGDQFFYRCRCGEKYELIRSSNPDVKEFLKFKYVKVVEQEYALN